MGTGTRQRPPHVPKSPPSTLSTRGCERGDRSIFTLRQKNLFPRKPQSHPGAPSLAASPESPPKKWDSFLGRVPVPSRMVLVPVLSGICG